MKKLENQLIKKYNECLRLKLFISWRAFLEIQYEIASEKMNYNKCSMIQELIIMDINS